MTTAEPVAPKLTAKQLAEQALEENSQLRTELTELRTSLRETGSVVLPQTDAVTPAQLDDLESRTAEGFERLQSTVDQLKATAAAGGGVAFDPAPIMAKVTEGLQGLEGRVSKSFTEQARIIDSWGKSLIEHEANLNEIRQAMPSVATLVSTVTELADKVRLFDEAGVTPASEEDLISVHQQVNELHRRMNDLVTERMVSAADRTVIDMHGAQVPAIYAQVHELMKLVTEIGKDKQADQKMGGYRFRSIDAAMDAVGHALRTVGVMFQPREILDKRVERYETVSKDGWRQNWTHVWVTQRYAFVSLVDGSEMAAIEMDGEARDNGDKSTSKADSMRLKYALLQALMIPINGLPESDGSDGTDGGQTYGRGDACESWENATPAPARTGHERYVDSSPPSAPEEVENSATAGREMSAPAPEDTRTPEEKATAAYNALVALAGLEQPARRPKLDAILRAMNAQGIADIEVTGVDGRLVVLGRYAAAVNAQVGA